MNLGNRLFHARKKSGLNQEEVAERLGVSRQTISKWETGESIPDLYQSKRMTRLYGISLDSLLEFDLELEEIHEMIEKTSDELTEKIDWTSAWAKKYPILGQFQQEVNVAQYAYRINMMFDELKEEYGYNEQDTMLVFKDILYQTWKARKVSKNKK